MSRPSAISHPTLDRLLQTLAPLNRPIVVGIAVAAASAAAATVPALIVRRIIDRSIPAGSDGSLIAMAILLIVFAALASALGVVRDYVTTVVAQRAAHDLRNTVYEAVRRQSAGFFGDARAADLTALLTTGIDGAAGGIAMAGAVAAAFFAVAATLVAMLLFSPLLTLIAIAMIPLLLLPKRRLERIRADVAARDRDRLGGLSQMVGEALGAPGAALAKTFGRDRHEGLRFAQQTRAIRDTAIRDAIAGRWLAVGRHAAWAAAPAIVWLIGGGRAIDGAFTVGGIVAFTMLQARVIGPVERLLSARTDFATVLARFARIFETFDLVPDVKERPGAPALASPAGAVEFDRVTVASRGPESLLREVTFEVPPRRMLAVVGAQPSAMPVFASLLARLHDPESGAVLLDGHDLRDVTLASVADAVGIVTREPFLFHASVRDNILYGRPDAPEGHVAEAAKAARIHDVILTFPGGYDTVVGAGGHPLSPSEALRIAIARTILKNPAVVVVDEPAGEATSDERAAGRAIQLLIRGRTAIVLARRVQTVTTADQIVVLDAGRIAERGTHADLLERNGLYARLYRDQLAAGPRLADVLA